MESGYYPGFNVKITEKNGVKLLMLESNSYTNTTGDVDVPNDVVNVRILRMNGFLYYSFDGGRFIKLNDYTDYAETITPFNTPVTFGAGLDANGKPRRFFKGIISDVTIKFIDNEATIDDYNPPLRTAYRYEGTLHFGTAEEMIDTGLYMFKDEDSLDKEFEISFIIKSIESGYVNQAVIINGKYEKESEGWPGFVFRLLTSGNVELTARGGSGNVVTNKQTDLIDKEIIISRRDRKLYITVNNGTEELAYDFTNFTNYFNVPITIGGSLENGTTPYRFFKGTLSNILIKVKD